MDTQPSRRKFLQQGVMTIGSVVAITFSVSTGAANSDRSNIGNMSNSKDATMPHVSVKMFPGRTMQQKTKLADAIVQDVVKHLDCSIDSVFVSIEEVSSQDWKEKVYDPDIQSKPGNLFKKPSYSM